jgi:hypothetical protein
MKWGVPILFGERHGVKVTVLIRDPSRSREMSLLDEIRWKRNDFDPQTNNPRDDPGPIVNGDFASIAGDLQGIWVLNLGIEDR